jgi:2-oxoglutarate dehydrogenase E2 component (dihydrolipoamide succinyltransferase)
MAVEVKVPSVGESITEVFISNWLKQEGDFVAKDEPLVELETDKATVEVHAPVAGTIVKLLKKKGDRAEIGDVIAQLEEGARKPGAKSDAKPDAKSDAKPEAKSDAKPEAKSDAKPEAKSDAKGAAKPDAAGQAGGKDAGDEPRIMPAAQRLLDEHGLDASAVEATGPGGRLLKEDVQRHVEARQARQAAPKAEAARPAPAAGAHGDREEEVVPMTPLRRTIARRLVEAKQNAALLTTFNEVDMSAVMSLRSEYKDVFEKRYGVRLGFMSFFVKASVDALKQFPQINAEIREQSIVYKNYYDIAVAVSTPKGLVTPVLRNAERLGFADIEKAIGDFGRRAQEGKLGLDELQGGTFTISNGGIFGSLLSTPIVNPPQSGVLGMHSIQERPVARDGQVVIRPMMYLALTYDHRIVDGREAVTFLTRIKDAVETPARMLLEI